MPHLRIATVNVNGIRAAARNGMGAWLDAADVDILTLQEVRGQDEHLEAALPGWTFVHDEATAKGRAGVAIASRVPAVASRTDFGAIDFDSKGRWIEADFVIGDRPLTVVSAYVHSGEADTPKQEEKWKFLDAFEARLAELGQDDGALALVTGDLNVGHRELDIKELARQPQEGRVPAARTRLLRPLPRGSRPDGRRRRRLHRHRPRLGGRRAHLPRRGRGSVHVVVDARAGLRQRLGLADRLPPRHSRSRRARDGVPCGPCGRIRPALE